MHDLWQATARTALPEDERRANLDHGPGLLLLAEDENAVGVVLTARRYIGHRARLLAPPTGPEATPHGGSPFACRDAPQGPQQSAVT